MKLRIAKKICKAMTEGDGGLRYSAQQHQQAANRFCGMKSSKMAEKFWNQVMNEIGVEGRAEVLAGSGAPGMAFELLMREEW